MQSGSSRIWTRVAVSISYDDNHYTTGTSVWPIDVILTGATTQEVMAMKKYFTLPGAHHSMQFCAIFGTYILHVAKEWDK